MKKFKKIGYIILIVIVVLLSLTIYTNASKNDEQTQNEKIFTEIKFVETKLINLFNTMNNIKISDYNIVTTEISKETTENNSSSESGGQGGTSGGNQNGEEGGQQSGGSSSGSDNSSGSSQQKSEEQEKFQLKSKQILTSETEEINWDSVKTEIENLYADLPSITMDLYQNDTINKEDILNFNNEFDKLTTIVKDENKEYTLEQLTKIYDYLPKFLRNLEQEDLYNIIVECKANIFKAYSKLDKENWGDISNDVKLAIDTYSKLLTNTNIEKQKQSNISKGYIMINELQNAVNLEDKEVFLIKYKNLLEEINNM